LLTAGCACCHQNQDYPHPRARRITK
jgi:hypothetical protein